MSRKLFIMVMAFCISLLALPLIAQDEGEEDGAVVSAVVFNVVTADIEAENGVVHVIDRVIVPDDLTIPEMAEMDSAEATPEAESTEMAEMDTEATPEAEMTPEAEDVTTILDVVLNSPDHMTLAAAVTAAELVDALDDPEATFTVFAPTDAAFEALLAELEMTPEDLLSNTELLLTVLGYHVIPGEALFAADLMELTSYDTLGGDNVDVGVGEDAVSSGLSMAGIEPMAEAEMTPEAEATEMAETTPDAEMTPETEVTEMAEMDAETTPEAEMTPEGDMAEATPDAEMTPEANDTANGNTIVDVAAGAGDFTTLVAAVEAADLVETLSGSGPFTVFAPTDEAFAAALEELGLTAEELLADTDALTDILTYHVIQGEFPSSAVVALDGQSIATVNGAEITISVDGETVMINEATVTQVDVEASNGVIHVIDSVLLPPAAEE